jgi:hypothetical protein
MERFEFPTWTNKLIPLFGVFVAVGGAYGLAVGAYGTSPKTTNVGYSPEQPVPFSHKTHAGMLKMDCRYCHTTVDKAAHAAIPATQTCINCHSAATPDGSVAISAIHTNSEKLLPIRESQATGKPVEWERVHDLPDFVYFDHAAHVDSGVSCVSCHGRVDKMDQVYQAETLSMSWCIDCHRNPEPHLRPLDLVTQLDWVPPEDAATLGARIKEELNINASTNCSTCHR